MKLSQGTSHLAGVPAEVSYDGVMAYEPKHDLKLHEQGDFYGPDRIRLPEFQVVHIAGEERHPIHFVGRYCVCEIHGSGLTRKMLLGASEEPSCGALTRNWNERFRAGKPIAWQVDTTSKPRNIVEKMALAVATTIMKEVRRYTEAPYWEIGDLLKRYPELYRDPAWLHEHVALGIHARELAIAKHHKAPEIIPLLRAVPVPWDELERQFAADADCGESLVSTLQLESEDSRWQNWLWLKGILGKREFNSPKTPDYPSMWASTSTLMQSHKTPEPDSTLSAFLSSIHHPTNEEICLLSTWSPKELRVVRERLNRHPEWNLKQILEWQKAGWRPPEILREMDLAAQELSKELTERWSAPPPPAEPWSKSVLKELSSSGFGIQRDYSLWDLVEDHAAPEGWWKNIEVETPDQALSF